MADANISTSPGDTNNPVFSSSTISFNPPELLAITGVPSNIDSIAVIPNGSAKVGTTCIAEFIKF